MKPIIVFGGSFNPPTNAHMALAEQIVNEMELDTFLFMPVGDTYPKEGLLPAKHRLAMLQAVCEDIPKFEVSTIEIDSPRLLPTIDTLERVQENYPNHDIYFVLGTDNLRDLPNWDEYERMVKDFKLLVLERDNDQALDIVKMDSILCCYQDNIIIMKEEIRTNCSSTLIRNRLGSGKGVRFLVPAPVLKYIEIQQLYR